MEQVQQIVDGEREYTKIRGGTGPLVYPAAHVWIYKALYYLTNNGKDILLAQYLFAGLYLITLATAMICYRNAKVSKHLFSSFFFLSFSSLFFITPGTNTILTQIHTSGSSLYTAHVGPFEASSQRLHVTVLQ